MQQNGPRDASIRMDSTGTFNVFSYESARSCREPAVATAVGAAFDFDGDFVGICLTLHARTKKGEPNFATDATNSYHILMKDNIDLDCLLLMLVTIFRRLRLSKVSINNKQSARMFPKMNHVPDPCLKQCVLHALSKLQVEHVNQVVKRNFVVVSDELRVCHCFLLAFCTPFRTDERAEQ